MILYIDIDGTICTENSVKGKTAADYEEATPFTDRISHINKLFEQGHEIHYWTARGASTGKDWTDLTTRQLARWNAKYTQLHMGSKPHFDAYICDKSWNSEQWFTQSLYEQIPSVENH